MTGTMWDRISAGYRSVQAGEAQQVKTPEGINIYRSGNYIRIDVPTDAETEVHDPPRPQ